jgi:hypothetical protein
MRITQARVSNGIGTFKDAYLKRYGLVEDRSLFRPIVLFGMYHDDDYQFYLSHRKQKIVVWCGSDSMMLNNRRAAILRLRKEAIHIAKSKFISDDLKKYNIPHTVLPVTWQVPDLRPAPKGDRIYHYGEGRNNLYGNSYLPLIEERTGFSIIKTTANTFTREELRKVYADCFIGLRLTKHDGVPNTVVELGMMGRRCLYNGGLPNAIPWININDICESIVNEFNRREVGDMEKVSGEILRYIDIGDEWLNI